MKNQEYLSGLRPELPEAFQMLGKVFEEQVFEIWMQKNREGMEEYHIPYMMNDALECCLVPEHCRMKGESLDIPEGKVYGSLETNPEGYGLIVRPENGTVLTLWFTALRVERRFYRYHEIGHFWAEGQEQWRRIVYIVGTLHDKFQYFGEEACNPWEMELQELAGFAPLMRWSPLGDAPEIRPVSTAESIRRMKKLAEEAKDREYRRLLGLYEKFQIPAIAGVLGEALTKPARIPLYLLLEEKIRAASVRYEKRDYGKQQNLKIRKEKEQADRELRAMGFEGKWPEYRNGRYGITVMEEHPFAAGETLDIPYRIRFMVSDCPGGCTARNAGFFRGNRRKGFIAEQTGEIADRIRGRNGS